MGNGFGVSIPKEETMNINFTFKNFEPSDHLKKYAQSKFERLMKFAEPKSDNAEVQVNLTVDKFRHVAEVAITGDSINITATEESADMYSTIDLVLDKLDTQLRRMREKLKDRRKRAARGAVNVDFVTFSDTDAGREKTIEESDSYDPMPMSVEEAAEQLDSLDYEFLVFTNAETARVNVIYRRKENVYGLIDPGA
jgi:putative sigma-54 modulation protein